MLAHTATLLPSPLSILYLERGIYECSPLESIRSPANMTPHFSDVGSLVFLTLPRAFIRRLRFKHARIGRVREPTLTPPSEQRKSVLLHLRIRHADQLGKVRVLLADDHRQFLTIAENLLAPAFEIVGSVPDGQAPFDVAKGVKPDVILTDISMPILGGMEASRQLNESGCAVKIIFMTAHADADFVEACLAAGALGYVLKSRIMTDLLPAIQEALEGRIFISPPFSNQGRIA
jgi:CheY-like chemotaxis protein